MLSVGGFGLDCFGTFISRSVKSLSTIRVPTPYMSLCLNSSPVFYVVNGILFPRALSDHLSSV